MYISQETLEQTHQRLSRVIASASLEIFEEPYAFVEVPVSSFPIELVPEAVALVRDRDVWSALVPSTSPKQERFVLFSFHFAADLDNSGFVGWLASHLKATLGTGILVVCGQNSAKWGVFDYWGAPISLAQDVLHEVQRLRSVAQLGVAAVREPARG